MENNIDFNKKIDIYIEGIDSIVKKQEIEIENKEEIIVDLEAKIETQNNVIEQLKREYEKVIKEKKITESKLAYLEKSNGELSVIVINNFKQALKYSDGIILQYMEQIDWSKIDFNEIYYGFDSLIKENKLELADYILLYISDERIREITESQFNIIINMVENFIDKQLLMSEFYLTGLELFFEKLDEEKYFQLDSFKKFLNKYNNKLIDIAKNTLKTQNNIHFCIILLKFNFILKEYGNVIIDINHIQKMLEYHKQINIVDLFNILYISLYFEMNNMIFSTFDKLKILPKKEYPEMIAYKKYIEFMTNTKSDYNIVLNDLKNLKGKMKCVSLSIKDDIIKKMEEDIIKNKRSTSEIKIIKADELLMLELNTNNCPYDNKTLVAKECFLAYFDGNNLKGYIKSKVFYCGKCGKAYLDEKLKNEISEEVKPFNIRIDKSKKNDKIRRKVSNTNNKGKYDKHLYPDYEFGPDGRM